MAVVLPATLHHFNLSGCSNVSGCTNVSGSLPPAVTLLSVSSLDLSGTSMGGALPESWNNFEALSGIDISETLIRCTLAFTEEGQVNCSLTAWIGINGCTNEVLAIGSSGAVVAGLQCPIFAINSQSRSSLVLDDA